MSGHTQDLSEVRLVLPLEKGWTPEARLAAAEARKAKQVGKKISVQNPIDMQIKLLEDNLKENMKELDIKDPKHKAIIDRRQALINDLKERRAKGDKKGTTLIG